LLPTRKNKEKNIFQFFFVKKVFFQICFCEKNIFFQFCFFTAEVSHFLGTKNSKTFFFSKKYFPKLFLHKWVVPQKNEGPPFFSFFHKRCTFLFLTASRKIFFEKSFSFCYFFIFLLFCSFLLKTSKNKVIFDQIFGTFTEMKNGQKMFIFRLQSVLRPQVCHRKFCARQNFELLTNKRRSTVKFDTTGSGFEVSSPLGWFLYLILSKEISSKNFSEKNFFLQKIQKL